MSDIFTPTPADLELLAQVVQNVARIHRLLPADAEDLAQSVQLRLVERDYDIFRRFKGRSSLKTYLTVVVVRMLLDWRNASYGKWRPSAAARQLGDHAVLLQRLIYRDQFTSEQAIQIAAGTPGAPPIAELQRLASQLPPQTRRRMVSDDDLESLRPTVFADPIDAAEQASARRRVGARLARALRMLPSSDRQLLYLRYVCNRSVSDIANALQTDRKKLYRRIDVSLRRLRTYLVASGITRAAAL